MSSTILWEACSEGVQPVQATALLKSKAAAERIAKSMAQRLGCAVLVRHNVRPISIDQRIAEQRIIRRFKA